MFLSKLTFYDVKSYAIIGDMMYYSNNVFNLYYEKYGNKDKKLVILPGWGDNRKTWDYFINIFSAYFTIYIFDYPGFGNTKFPNNDLTISDYARVFNNFLDDNNILNPIIIGHSFGGRLIILLSHLYKKRFHKIILMDSAGIKNFSFSKTIKKYLYKFLKKCKFFFKDKNKYLHKLLSIFGSNDFKNINPNMQRTFINIVNTNLIKYIPSIKNETLIIWGKNDTETPFKDAIKFNKLIPNSYLIQVDNSGHFPYLDYPYLINDIIYEYVKEDIF